MAYHDASTLLRNPDALAFPEHQSVLECYLNLLESTKGMRNSGAEAVAG